MEIEEPAGHEDLINAGQVEVGDYLVALVDHEAVDVHEDVEVVAAEDWRLLVFLAHRVDDVEEVG